MRELEVGEQAAWVEAAPGGDEAAFARLVRYAWAPVVRSVERFVGDHHEAQDLVQEALLRAHSNLHRLDRRTNFRAWVRRIARNVAVDRLRRQHPNPELMSPELLGLVAEPPERTEVAQERARNERRLDLIWRGVAALPSRERRVLLLFYGRGMSVRAIADECGGTEAGVKVTLHRGRRRLWERLKRSSPDAAEVARRA